MQTSSSSGASPARGRSSTSPEKQEAGSLAVTDEHPYSPARAVAGFVFVSGALSVDPSGRPAEEGLPSLEAAMERLEERLSTVGAKLRDVVRTTYFVTDLALRDRANQHYREVFGEPRPARSFVEVKSLPYGASVEIEAIAYIGEGSVQNSA